MLRSAILYLAGADWPKAIVTHFGPVRRTALRFVAGETLADAIEVTRLLNAEGLDVTLDHLGESITSEQGAQQAAEAYLELLDTVAETGVSATASLKLTHLGLDIGEELCIHNLRRILQRAQETGNHITIDMESSDYTDRTLAVFRALRREFDNLGTVIQAYLYRSEDDMKALGREGAFVRLCKGAYHEPPDRAFPDKADVDANFIHLAHLYLSEDFRAAGAYLAVATHDEKMIAAVKEYVQAHDVPYDQFEFQMLYGIRPKLQAQLRDDGFKVRIYVGYGTEWYPFFMRRLAERPANLWFIIRNILRR